MSLHDIEKTCPKRNKRKGPASIRYCLLAAAVAGLPLLSPTARAGSDTWDNGGGDNNWQTFTNWVSDTQFPGATSGFSSTDDATFSTSGAAGTINLGGTINARTLIFGVGTGNAASFTVGTAGDTLNFTTAGGVTIGTGVTAAQNIGVSGTTLNLSTAANATATFTNNGSGLLTIAGNLVQNQASGSGLLTVGGTGNTTITGTITNAGAAGATSLLKSGSGTLTLSNGSVWGGTGAQGSASGNFPLVARSGTLLLNGGTHTVNGELVIGGYTTGGTAGNNAKLQIDAGALNITSYLSVGRGNGTGSVSSDLVVNNAATVTAANFSAGYNGNNGANLPKGSVTLNNTASLTIGSAGQFTFGESTGSNFTMTLNNSSGVTLSGTGSATNRQIAGAGATASITLNDSSTFTNSGGQFNVGYQTGNGTLTVNTGATFTSGGEMRVGATNVNGAFAGGSGTVNVAGGSLSLNSLTIARNNDAAGEMNGAVNITNSGSVTVTSGLAIVGFQGDGVAGGALKVSSGTFSANGVSGTTSFVVGTGSSGRGTVTVDGGTLNSLNDMVVADNNSSSGTVTLSSGTINVGTSVEKWLKVNNNSSGNATITVSGGTLNLNNNSDLRFTPSAAATGTNTFTLSAGFVQGQTGNQNGIASLTSVLDMNDAATGAANNTFNLNGGTLLIGQVLSSAVNNAGGSRTFNFNGGTLKAAGATTTFFNLGSGTGTAAANVRGSNGVGCAIIDSNNFAITIAQPLVHSTVSGDNSAIDGGLTKQGAGTLTLTGGNTYTGPTNVSVGTLALSSTTSANNIAASSSINVASGATLDVSGINVTGSGARFSLGSGQTLKGNGTVTGPMTVAASSTISPGGSTGLLTTGSETWAGGGTYQWEINNAGGTAGSTTSGWDKLSMGTLNVTADVGSKFTLAIISLDSNQQAGQATFNTTQSQSWIIASTTGISGNGIGAFNVFLDTANFQNDPGTKNFGIGTSGTDVVLTYTPSPTPEPGSVGLLGIATMGLLGRRRRRST